LEQVREIFQEGNIFKVDFKREKFTDKRGKGGPAESTR
jgi:hypothetical protein